MENRVLIAVPSRYKIPAQFLSVFASLIVTTSAGGIKTGLHQGFGSGIGHVRNHIVEEFLKGSWSHLLFLDDDVFPSPDAILRLLSHRKSIVSGLYQRRQFPHYQIVLFAERGDQDKVMGFEYRYRDTCPPKGQLIKCDAVGAGCLLIERKVFEKIDRPWFRVTPNLGEDIYFCMNATKAGFPIYVDTSVHCLHLVEHVAGEPEDIEEFNNRFQYNVDLASARS